MNNISEIVKLIKKKLDGTLDAHELAILEDWAKKDLSHSKLLRSVEEEEVVLNDVLLWLEMQEKDREITWRKKLEQQTFKKIQSETPLHSPRKKNKYVRALPYAASLLILLFAGYFYFQNAYIRTGVEVADLEPGVNRATITLFGGRTIELDESQEGVVLLGPDLTYQDGTLISEFGEEETADLEIKIPRGGQYKITLEDGTKVWLNADSKMIYPSRFDEKSREVEIVGEAYLEVASVYNKGKKVPFRVKTAQQTIEVLGTQFNIKAYAGEDVVQTTLIEGAVKILAENKELHLLPGEQSMKEGKTLAKRKVDTEQYIAWKNNQFIFYETELHEAMEMLSRWYNFETIYADDIPPTHFYGTISREKSLAEVLKVMKISGIKYKIEKTNEGNKLTLLK